jgi:hypothetical protein
MTKLRFSGQPARPWLSDTSPPRTLRAASNDLNCFPPYSRHFFHRQAATTHAQIPATMSSLAPQCQPDSSDEVKDEQLLLSPDQPESIETFRRDVRRCETDEEKFRLCAEARG